MSESWLLIETSGRVGKVGLARGGMVARAAELDASRRHARDLTAAVDVLLKAESLGPRDLTGVMVGIGPGSYTGLRVGVMAAKALAYATGCRLVPPATRRALCALEPLYLGARSAEAKAHRAHPPGCSGRHAPSNGGPPGSAGRSGFTAPASAASAGGTPLSRAAARRSGRGSA